jgi:tetratricopeptide (TPR) repeat protein
MAAVLGRSFSYEVLKALHDMTVVTGDEVALLRSMDELWHRQIIGAHDTEDDLYDFTHDRLRQVAYRGLSPIVRRAHHLRAARALNERYAHALDAVASQIAYHYGRAGENKLAADYHYRAAVHAAGQFAHEQTIRHCLQAVTLLGDEDTAAPIILADLYAELARAYRFTARHRKSADAYTSALAQTTEPLARAMLYREAGEAATAQMDFATAQDRFEQAVHELMKLSLQDETWWRAWLDAKQAWAVVYYYQSQLTNLDAVLSEIADPMAKHGTAGQKSDYYGALTQLTLRRERYVGNTELMAYVSEALHWAEASGDAEKIALHRFGYGFALLTTRRLEEALASLERAYEAEKQMGNASVLNQIVIYLLVTLRIQDRVEDVRARLEESLTLAYQQGSPHYIGAAEGHAAWVAYRDGDLNDAREHCATALGHWQQTVYPFQWIACMPALALALHDGDLTGACDAARRMTASNQEQLPAELEEALQAACAAGQQNAVACEDALRTALTLARSAGYL